jgi:hypothetical protein
LAAPGLQEKGSGAANVVISARATGRAHTG